jgi:hypothetical protein
MKRILIVGAALSLSLALAACGEPAADQLAQAEQADGDQPVAAPSRRPPTTRCAMA